MITALGRHLGGEAARLGLLIEAAHLLLSLAIATAMFAAIYKILPDVRISWRDVAIGAAITAILFHLGKYLIAAYLGLSNIASSYGAAGALVIVLVWVYYSTQVFLLGAEFTRAYAFSYGSRRADGASRRRQPGNAQTRPPSITSATS
jgi:membrane protein